MTCAPTVAHAAHAPLRAPTLVRLGRERENPQLPKPARLPRHRRSRKPARANDCCRARSACRMRRPLSVSQACCRAEVTVVAVFPPPARDESSSSTRVLSLAWWVRDQKGRWTLAQWPNPALSVWLVAVLVGWTGVLGATRGATLADLGRGALVVWALDELIRGASPIRRLLGAVVLAMQLVRLVPND